MCFTHHTVTALDAAIVGVSWFIGLHSSLTVTHCHGFNASPVHDYTHPSSTGANHREWWVHGRDGRDDSNASVKVDHMFWEVSLCVFDQTLRIVQLPLKWTDGALNLKHKASYIFCPLGDNYMRQRSRRAILDWGRKKLRIINVISKNNQGLGPTSTHHFAENSTRLVRFVSNVVSTAKNLLSFVVCLRKAFEEWTNHRSHGVLTGCQTIPHIIGRLTNAQPSELSHGNCQAGWKVKTKLQTNFDIIYPIDLLLLLLQILSSTATEYLFCIGHIGF